MPPAPDRTFASRLLYACARAFFIVLAKIAWSVRIVGTEHIPDTGPVILAPTHRSLLDIPMMVFVTARAARFMGKAELWKYRVLGVPLSVLGGFPVKRGTPDRAALARSFEALEAGAPLVVFPEGTRGSGPMVQDIQEGVAYLAAKSGAMIVPIGVAGTEAILEKGRKLPRFTNVAIHVGEPIVVERSERRLDRAAMDTVTAQLRAGLQSSFDLAQAQLRR